MMQGSVGGIVVDGATGEPMEAATIAVWSGADSSLVTGAITDAKGAFAIEGLRRGRYYIEASFIGYRPLRIADVAVTPAAPRVDLGTIRLEPDNTFLDEVEVTAERAFVEVGIDRTVYNTKDQPVTAGGSASDVLRNIPSVEVDIDGNVSLRGNQNVAILINGRPSPMTGEALTSFLQGLPSEMVERVEVIPNPSARYDPDGMSGILNIVLRQQADIGLGGNLTANGGTQSSFGASGNLNYGKGPWGIFTSYSLRGGNRDSEGDTFRENRFMDPLTYLDQEEIGERTMLSNTFNTTVDYRLSRQNTVSLSAMLSQRGGTNDGLTAYRTLDAGQDLTERLQRSTTSERSDFNMDYRLSFKRVLEAQRHELSAELRYEGEWEDDRGDYTQQLLTAAGAPAGPAELETSDVSEQNNEATFQIDYIRPLAGGRLETGLKSELRLMNSEAYLEDFDHERGTWVPDVGQNNAFDYDQQIHAAYGIYAREAGRLGVQVGVRLEQALNTFDLKTTGEAYDNNYFSAFPSAFLTYKLQESEAGSRSVKLSYSKRINRPNEWQLNPFGDFQDPLFRRVGNPYLNPEYTHSFEASLTQFTQGASLTLTPYFRRTVDVVRWYTEVTPDGVSVTTFRNLDESDSWGAEAIGTLRLGQRLNAFASFNAYRVVTDGSNVSSDYSNDAFGWAARGNATINLTPDLDLQLSYFYRAPMNVEGGRMGAMSRGDIGVRQKLWGERASLSLRLSDPFNTMVMRGWREDDRFYQQMRRDWNARQLNLTFTYNFGQQQRRPNRSEMERGDGEEMEQMGM